jgi:hypothetical protein
MRLVQVHALERNRLLDAGASKTQMLVHARRGRFDVCARGLLVLEPPTPVLAPALAHGASLWIGRQLTAARQ